MMLKSFVLSGRDLSRYPLSLLPSGLKTFLATLFPILLISNWPTQLFLLDNVLDMLQFFAGGLFVTVLWVMFAAYVWRRGLRVYEGQSL